MEYKARVTVYCSIAQVEQIKALAYTDKTSMSDYIGKLIDAHLAKQRGKAAKQAVAHAPEHVTPARDVAVLPGQHALAEREQEGAPCNA